MVAPRGRWLWSAKAASKRRGSRSLRELGAVAVLRDVATLTQSIHAAERGFVGRYHSEG
jgi:hypothetical protein